MPINIPNPIQKDIDIPENYGVVQVTKLLTGDKVRSGHNIDFKVIAISFPKGRNGTTVITYLNPLTLEYGTQIYKNKDRVFKRIDR